LTRTKSNSTPSAPCIPCTKRMKMLHGADLGVDFAECMGVVLILGFVETWVLTLLSPWVKFERSMRNPE
ncbi:unnamed protein product, partial [Sphenostylis stenocarpa]